MTDAQPADQLVAAVYRERAHLVAALTKHYPAGWRDDPDSPGWAVVYVDLPTGQVSWHISPADMDVFPDLPAYPGEWDYHSTEEKYRRLDALPIAREMAERERELVAAARRVNAQWPMISDAAQVEGNREAILAMADLDDALRAYDRARAAGVEVTGHE